MSWRRKYAALAGEIRVLLIGQDLKLASQVTFSNVPATFTVVSSHEITTAVPAGATSGKIVVTTPKGSVSGYRVFTVLNQRSLP